MWEQQQRKQDPATGEPIEKRPYKCTLFNVFLNQCCDFFNAGQDQQKSFDTNSTDETLYDGNGTAAVDR